MTALTTAPLSPERQEAIAKVRAAADKHSAHIARQAKAEGDREGVRGGHLDDWRTAPQLAAAAQGRVQGVPGPGGFVVICDPNPSGLCMCGCGERAPIATRTDPTYGTVRGRPARYIRNHHRRLSPVEYTVNQETGCWEWQRYVGPNGYGVAMGQVLAHRHMYERLVGPIPDGLVLDHLCRVRHCVNPAHLEAVTQRENLLRGEGVVGRNYRKTHCVNGHAFDDDNTIREADGSRRCVTCRRAHGALRAARKSHERQLARAAA